MYVYHKQIKRKQALAHSLTRLTLSPILSQLIQKSCKISCHLSPFGNILPPLPQLRDSFVRGCATLAFRFCITLLISLFGLPLPGPKPIYPNFIRLPLLRLNPIAKNLTCSSSVIHIKASNTLLMQKLFAMIDYHIPQFGVWCYHAHDIIRENFEFI